MWRSAPHQDQPLTSLYSFERGNEQVKLSLGPLRTWSSKGTQPWALGTMEVDLPRFGSVAVDTHHCQGADFCICVARALRNETQVAWRGHLNLCISLSLWRERRGRTWPVVQEPTPFQWRPSLLGWRPSLVGWRPFLVTVTTKAISASH